MTSAVVRMYFVLAAKSGGPGCILSSLRFRYERHMGSATLTLNSILPLDQLLRVPYRFFAEMVDIRGFYIP